MFSAEGAGFPLVEVHAAVEGVATELGFGARRAAAVLADPAAALAGGDGVVFDHTVFATPDPTMLAWLTIGGTAAALAIGAVVLFSEGDDAKGPVGSVRINFHDVGAN